MWYTKKLNIFSLFQSFLRIQKPFYDHFSRPSGRPPQLLLAPHVGPYLRASKVAIHVHSVIFLRLGVRSVSFCMCVVSFAKRIPARKRSSLNGFQSFVALTLSAPTGSKRPSVSSDSKSGAKPERMWEVSWASAEVAIRSCVWFANHTRQLNQP